MFILCFYPPFVENIYFCFRLLHTDYFCHISAHCSVYTRTMATAFPYTTLEPIEPHVKRYHAVGQCVCMTWHTSIEVQIFSHFSFNQFVLAEFEWKVVGFSEVLDHSCQAAHEQT